MKTIALSLAVLVAVPALANAQVMLYSNTFDNEDALNGLTVLERGTERAPPGIGPLSRLQIEDGQLRIDTAVVRNPDPQGVPQVFGGAVDVFADTRVLFGPQYNPILSQNQGILQWAFNVSNRDSNFNNAFTVSLGRDVAPGQTAIAYEFVGGGLVASRMLLLKSGLDGIIVDVPAEVGLGTLPQRGSFRITFDPSNGRWEVFGHVGPEYVDPTQVTESLGVGFDDTFTDISLPFFSLSSRTSGTTFFDNVSVSIIPEPATATLAGGLLALGLAFLARRQSRRNERLASAP